MFTVKIKMYKVRIYKKIQVVSDVINVNLYERDKLRVVVGWVPMPVTNERIKTVLENLFGPVPKTVKRKCKDGLIFSIRILII